MHFSRVTTTRQIDNEKSHTKNSWLHNICRTHDWKISEPLTIRGCWFSKNLPHESLSSTFESSYNKFFLFITCWPVFIENYSNSANLGRQMMWYVANKFANKFFLFYFSVRSIDVENRTRGKIRNDKLKNKQGRGVPWQKAHAKVKQMKRLSSFLLDTVLHFFFLS